MTQTNTQTGELVFNSSESLEGKEGYLATLINTGGVAELALPNSEQDLVPYVITDGADEDENTAVLPLSPDKNVRLKLDGTCPPGATLVLAEIDGTHDGMVRNLPTAAGVYRAIAIAEEAGVDEQLVKARPANIGWITVAGESE